MRRLNTGCPFADVVPLEEEEDGFSTEYFDAPIPQPPFGGSWRSSSLAGRRSPVLLNMQGEREMWVSYQTERRRTRMLLLLLGLTCVVIFLCSSPSTQPLFRVLHECIFNHFKFGLAPWPSPW